MSLHAQAGKGQSTTSRGQFSPSTGTEFQSSATTENQFLNWKNYKENFKFNIF